MGAAAINAPQVRLGSSQPAPLPQLSAEDEFQSCALYQPLSSSKASVMREMRGAEESAGGAVVMRSPCRRQTAKKGEQPGK